MTRRARFEHWLHHQWHKRGLLSVLLRPLSALVNLYTKRKSQRPREALNFLSPPIIVVGNIIVGGAGKTPVVLALCEYLKKQGWQPGIISRGYGVRIEGAARVGQGQLDATHFGDEPTLLAQQSGVPIAVHPKRNLALAALCQSHPEIDVIIADDGLQHQALPRDIEIIVQDERGIGNGLLLPAGPLREPPDRLKQANWLITQLSVQQNPPSTPTPPEVSRCISMQLWPSYFEQLSSGECVTAEVWRQQVYENQSCIALAAIGQPNRFFSMLQQFGIKLHQQIALADHSQLPVSAFHQLKAPLLLITAKDAVKYQSVADPRIWVVHVQPRFSPPLWLHDLHQHLQLIEETKKQNRDI